MAINDQLQLGRAKNVILSLLQKRLSVPRIYIDADWDGERIDVLAIDRDGVGDVHAVLLFAQTRVGNGVQDSVAEGRSIDGLLDRFSSIAAQYKYIAAVNTNTGTSYRFGISPVLLEKSFAPDGLGRVGFLTVETSLEDEPTAAIVIKPERFRAVVASLATEYVQNHAADWEIRA